mmetsp:Transcript_36975/g.82828  ORF Transcript_36975/g.82828 Transcript_36975/m.82828 type:complete len:408 (+) Transcript_36975:127-1350(+)
MAAPMNGVMIRSIFLFALSASTESFVPSFQLKSARRQRVGLHSSSSDIERAKAFLMGDQETRLSELFAARSVEEKEQKLEKAPEKTGGKGGDVEADSKGDAKPPPSSPPETPLAAVPETSSSLEDPILGQLLVDLPGEKRVYLADVPKLLLLPVWERQRVYRKDRAKQIAMDKLRKKSTPGSGGDGESSGSAQLTFPGVIAAYEKAWEPAPELDGQSDEEALAKARSRFGIVDGQHRVGALRILYGRGDFDGRVLLEVFPLGTEEAVSDLFAEINKAEPVKDVDMPGQASDFERETLLRVTGALKTAFPDMFKDSTKCRKPHVNVDNLRDELFAAKVMERHGHIDDESLLAWILRENDLLGERGDDEWFEIAGAGKKGGAGVAFKKALKKARAFGFFLGLENSWLEN